MASNKINLAKNGDINAFHELYVDFQPQLKSYLYRLLVDRNEVEDIAHDTFLKAFDNVAGFDEKASLKSWVFRIATNLAYDRLRNRGRWSSDVMDKAKEHAHGNEYILVKMQSTSQHSKFDIREHIDFCFTCLSKVLPLDQQIAVILKDIYAFKVKEIATIMDLTIPKVKHVLRFGRQAMTDIFDSKCALINKKGACHQCSELNTALNPKQKQQELFIKDKLTPKDADKRKLYKLRKALIRPINPLNIEGAELHDIFMQINRKVEGEIEEINFGSDN